MAGEFVWSKTDAVAEGGPDLQVAVAGLGHDQDADLGPGPDPGKSLPRLPSPSAVLV